MLEKMVEKVNEVRKGVRLNKQHVKTYCETCWLERHTAIQEIDML